jgi:hypothetical protein
MCLKLGNMEKRCMLYESHTEKGYNLIKLKNIGSKQMTTSSVAELTLSETKTD